jgi:hypothetical protein
MGSLYQHLPQVSIPFFGDPQLGLTLTGVAAPGPQARIAANVPAFLEARFIF